MPFYFISCHFRSFRQVERFPGPNTLKCFSFQEFDLKECSNQPSNQWGQPGTPQEHKKAIKTVFLTDIRKKQQRHSIFFPDARKQCVRHPKKQITQAPSQVLKSETTVYMRFLYTYSCPGTCNSWRIIVTTLLLDGSCGSIVILLA